MSTTTLRIFTVDAFAAAPFSGNPAAVCLVPSSIKLTDAQQQKIAAEMNLSETAFVTPINSSAGATEDESVFKTETQFGLRWFTPAAEVNLCGHATLATAHVLVDEVGNASPKIAFETLSGTLYCESAGIADEKSRKATISIDLPTFPAKPYGEIVAGKPEAEQQAILNDVKTVTVAAIGEKLFGELGIDVGRDVVIDDFVKYLTITIPGGSAAIKAIGTVAGSGGPGGLRKGTEGYAAGERLGLTALSITSGGDGASFTLNSDSVDFVSRLFGPWVAVDEDPVTGSLHSVLVPLWAGRIGGNKATFNAVQESPRRGELVCKISADGGRVTLVGGSFTIINGNISF
ncbi:Diaminopimelate epimerase-like protein [Ramicandelaber brevisporus]|nr:Diaminopimelate epimerase-like protein [Ramicandelaber brevisporus]